MTALYEEDLTRRGRVILAAIEAAHAAGLLYGGDAYEAIDPSGWAKSTFPAAAEVIDAAIRAAEKEGRWPTRTASQRLRTGARS